MKKTSFHLKGCNIASIEEHNKRLKEYLEKLKELGKNIYIREELSHLNQSWENTKLYSSQRGKMKTCCEIFEDLKQLYKEKVGQEPQLKDRTRVNKKTGREYTIAGWSPLQEGVVVIKDDTTMNDFNGIKKWFEKRKMNIVRIDIHHDEGHYNKNNEWIENRHAHIVIDKVDHSTGKTVKLNEKDMSELQDVVAESLGMERGERKEITGKRHLEREEFINQQENLEKTKQALVERQQLLEQISKELVDKSKELEDVKSAIEKNRKTLSELNEIIDGKVKGVIDNENKKLEKVLKIYSNLIKEKREIGINIPGESVLKTPGINSTEVNNIAGREKKQTGEYSVQKNNKALNEDVGEKINSDNDADLKLLEKVMNSSFPSSFDIEILIKNLKNILRLSISEEQRNWIFKEFIPNHVKRFNKDLENDKVALSVKEERKELLGILFSIPGEWKNKFIEKQKKTECGFKPTVRKQEKKKGMKL